MFAELSRVAPRAHALPALALAVVVAVRHLALVVPEQWVIETGVECEMIQGDQLYIAVCFWYLVKSHFPVFAFTVSYTEQIIFYKVPEQHSHVYLATLYVNSYRNKTDYNSADNFADNYFPR